MKIKEEYVMRTIRFPVSVYDRLEALRSERCMTVTSLVLAACVKEYGRIEMAATEAVRPRFPEDDE
jgi:hypothetical protein